MFFNKERTMSIIKKREKTPKENFISAKNKIMNVIKKITSLGFVFKNMGWNLKQNTFSANELENQENHIKIDYSKLNYEPIEMLELKNSFIRMITFIVFILVIFLILGKYSQEIFMQIEHFYDIKLIALFLKQSNYFIINSIFAINIANSKIQADIIKLKNMNFSIDLNNSAEYHKANLKIRAEIYQEKLSYFISHYLDETEFIMEKLNQIFNQTQKFYTLESNWKISERELSLIDFLQMQYREVNRILETDIMNSFEYRNDQFGFTINNNFFNFAKDFENYANFNDKSAYFYFQNCLSSIKNSFDILNNSLDESTEVIEKYYRTKLLIYLITLGFFVIFFFILEGIFFYRNYGKVYMKYVILYNILKFYHNEFFIKIELLNELFSDFTDLNRRKYLKLANNEELYKKKVFENLNENEDMNILKKNRDDKINFQISSHGDKSQNLINKTRLKSVRLFDYYNEIKTKADNAKKTKFNKLKIIQNIENKNYKNQSNEFTNRLSIAPQSNNKINNLKKKSIYLNIGISNKLSPKKINEKSNKYSIIQGDSKAKNIQKNENLNTTPDFETNSNLNKEETELNENNLIENLNIISVNYENESIDKNIKSKIKLNVREKNDILANITNNTLNLINRTEASTLPKNKNIVEEEVKEEVNDIENKVLKKP